MIYTIESQNIKVDVSDFKAELRSIISKRTGTEHLWQGDPEFWKDRAIVPFPICCRLNQGKYTYEGKTYEMKCHGFLQESTPAVISHTKDSIKLELCSNDFTRSMYPFEFRLDITYSVVGNTLKNSFTVTNTDNKTMYFSIGGHPGFNIPYCGGKFEDYSVEFPDAGKVQAIDCDDAFLMTGKVYDVPLRDGKYLDLRHNLFDHDALFLLNTGKKAILMNRNCPENSIVIDHSMSDCCCLGLWHKPKAEANYCCIEPFNGLPAYCDHIDDLPTKAAILSLESGKSFKFEFDITINY